MSVDEKLLCPSTGQVCSYREHVFALHTPIGSDAHLPPEYNSVTDGAKLFARLSEHSAVARVLGCEGPNDDFSCPTAETMANSRTRTASKTVVKKVISLFRGTK